MAKEKTVKVSKVKLKKTRRYSYVNAIDGLLERYFAVYQKLSEHVEGCISGEMYDRMNELLVEDYHNSISNLAFLSKKSMKYLKKRDSKERGIIFWYKFRRFFGGKKNEDIEKLIIQKENFKFEMAKLFEDLVSSNIRTKVEDMFCSDSEDCEKNIDEEPDFVDNVKDLFAGPDENRSLHGEIVGPEELSLLQKQSLDYKENE